MFWLMMLPIVMHGVCIGQIAATVQAFMPFDFVALEGTVAAIPS